MSQLLQAFLLGNTAIVTNVCMLPLYPGMIAFMAGTGAGGRGGPTSRWLGVAVLAGVLSLMLAAGGVLYQLQASFSHILGFVLPATYGVVGLLGLALLAGRNPFQAIGVDLPRFGGHQGSFAYATPATVKDRPTNHTEVA